MDPPACPVNTVEIVQLLSLGYDEIQIARQLDTTPEMVERQLRSVLRRWDMPDLPTLIRELRQARVIR